MSTHNASPIPAAPMSDADREAWDERVFGYAKPVVLTGGDGESQEVTTMDANSPLPAELTAKLEHFRAVLEAGQLQHLLDLKYNPENHNVKTVVHVGKKYARVDTGGSGKYMVVLETGQIFGIKAYGVIHRGHAYGTLDTVDNWDWRLYSAFPKPTQEVK